MSTIAERLDSLIARLGISERELARRAGLRSETHVGYLRSRLREEPGAVTLETLEKVARGAGVSLGWLVSGELQSTPATESSARSMAAITARKDGTWEPAILAVLAEPVRSEDAQRSANWWKLRMEMKEEELIDEGIARRKTRPSSER